MLFKNQILAAAGIGAQDIRRLEEAGETYYRIASQPVHQIPQIVCTGIYNAGKSTLLNALCGEEKFPTGDIPTTKVAAQAEFNGAVYIDTPGLNAETADDREAQAAYESADFILFVANIQNGGISEAESDWLQDLRRRYTADSLKQRLIYVLTHCGQMESEQVAAILDKIQSDLEKMLGFAPEQIFCVDSVTYQRGISGNKTLLVERSNILPLQVHLAELTAKADKLLSQARKAELDTQRKMLTDNIDQIQKNLQEKLVKVKKRIAEVDTAWNAFEKKLTEAMPPETNKPILYSINLPSRSFNTIEARTEYAVKKKLEELLRPIYDKRERIVRDEIRGIMERIKKYCFSGVDSAYVSYCNQITQVFNNSILALQKMGLSVSGINEISVVPELPSNLFTEIQENLSDDVVEYGGLYSLREYVDVYGDISYDTEYVNVIFGLEREVDVYSCYSDWSVVREMEKDIRSSLDRNVRSENDRLDRYWQDFCKKLNTEIAKRKTTLKRQVDDYKAFLEREVSPIRSASNELDNLIRKVSP